MKGVSSLVFLLVASYKAAGLQGSTLVHCVLRRRIQPGTGAEKGNDEHQRKGAPCLGDSESSTCLAQQNTCLENIRSYSINRTEAKHQRGRKAI